MQRRFVVTLAILAVVATGLTGCKKEEPAQAPETAPTAPAAPAAPTMTEPATTTTGLTGEQMFKQHCAVCHPNGGNTITPAKTLGAKRMADESNIKSPEDVVKIMRNPPPGMNKFDETMIPDEDAKKIGEYILATFP